MSAATDANARQGQGLVEFALVIPIFLLAFFGLIDVGRLVYQNSTISQAAREGGRLGAVEAYWVGKTGQGCNSGTGNGPVCPANDAALVADIRAAANRMMAPFGDVTNVYIQCRTDTTAAPTGNWTGSSCATRNAGDLIDVRVTTAYTAITPVAGQLVGPRTLSGSSTFVIN